MCPGRSTFKKASRRHMSAPPSLWTVPSETMSSWTVPSCLMFGVFNVGVGYRLRFYRRLDTDEDTENGVPLPPSEQRFDLFAHYHARITNDEGPLRDVSIRAPAPIYEAGLIPDNGFAFVFGPLCVPPQGRCCAIDASEMVVMPAEASPPLSDEVELFPPFPSSFIIGTGCVAEPPYRRPDGSCVFSIAVSEFVRGRTRFFRLR
jgi:hypothetical protein